MIGYLSTRSAEDTMHLAAAFRAGLAQSGYVEGQNVSIEYRWAFGEYNRLPALAAELVHHPVTVLASTGGEPAAFAATGVTSTIPIVYLIGGDSVKEGLAASFNQPGRNATGVTLLTNFLEPKRFSVLRDLIPGASMMCSAQSEISSCGARTSRCQGGGDDSRCPDPALSGEQR
jgi:putative tryptophan/tyrosine transport system substrate-binding protein